MNLSYISSVNAAIHILHMDSSYNLVGTPILHTHVLEYDLTMTKSFSKVGSRHLFLGYLIPSTILYDINRVIIIDQRSTSVILNFF